MVPESVKWNSLLGQSFLIGAQLQLLEDDPQSSEHSYNRSRTLHLATPDQGWANPQYKHDENHLLLFPVRRSTFPETPANVHLGKAFPQSLTDVLF